MNLIPIKEAATRNGLSRQRVHQLVQAGQVVGAVRIGSYWAIPDTWTYKKIGYPRARKPAGDRR